LRLFYSLIVFVVGAALLPVVPVAARSVAPAVTSTSAAYTAVTPKRVLDTRDGTGGVPVAPVGAGATIDLTVAGANGVPASATGVVLNVTAVNMTANGFLAVFPTAGSHNTSNLNYMAGQGPVANLVESPLGTGGAVSFFNSAGSTNVIADLQGYFAPSSGNAGGEVAISPNRITDTRAGSGKPNAGSTLGAGGTITVQVTGTTGVPATGVSAAVLNLTATDQTAASFFSVFPGATPPSPQVSNLNWVPLQNIANRVIVPVSATGTVTVFNQSGSADAIVDISGYFTTSALATGKFFTPLSPVRIADTRSGFFCPATLGAAGTCTLQIGGDFAGVPTSATAVILNVTGIAPSAAGFLTVYPSNISNPGTSDVNLRPGVIAVPNLVVATLSPSGQATFYNSAGTTDLAVDIFGFFGGAVAGVTVSATPSTLSADGTSTSTVTATVTNADGTAAVSDQVNFTSSGSPAASCGTIAGSPKFTDGTGKATVIYTASTTAGTCTITATEAAHNLSGTAAIIQTATKNTVAQAPANAVVAADGIATQVITDLVTNNGAPVSADSVTWTTSPSVAGSCGTFTTANPTNTSGGGVATVTYKSSLTAGFCNVTGTEAGNGATGKTQITQRGGGAQTIALTANPTSVPADGKTTSVLTATVSGTGASGDPVAFNLVGAACGSVSPQFVNANGSGVATATYTAGTTAGTCNAFATEANAGSSATAPITQTITFTVKVTANPPTINGDGVSTSTVTANVTNDVTKAAVSGDSITFAPTSGTACGTIPASAVITDSNGNASATYTSSIVVVGGNCTITANDGGPTGTGTGTVVINETRPMASAVSVSATPNSVPADSTTTSTIKATVTNSSGGPVPVDNVSFTSSGSPAGACGTFSAPSVFTNASGVATVTYTASGTAGTCTITATEGDSAKSGNTSVTQTVVKNAVAQTPAGSVPADNTSTVAITTIVTNKGVGVPGDTVNWTMAPSVPGACGTLTPTTATTPASGVVTTSYKANFVIGFCTVTGTETGNGSSATTVIQQHGSSAGTAVTETANPTTLPADGKSTSTITATVTGAGSANDPVIFLVAPSTCGSLSAASATTTAGGVATATYTASLTGGGLVCTIAVVEANGSKTASATVTQTTVNNIIAVTANPSAIKGDGIATSAITATVTSGVDGSAVSADALTWAVSGPNCGILSNTSAATNASGVGTATYTSSLNAGGIAHFCTVTVTETATGQSASVSIDQLA
jgi:hypothetical protein